MDQNIEYDQWTIYFKEFSKKNQLRPTQLQVFDQMGAQTEVHELPLMGINLEMRGEDSPRIEIMLEIQGVDAKHLTHVITRAQQVNVKTSETGVDEVMEIESEGNVKTLLRFEFLPERDTASLI